MKTDKITVNKTSERPEGVEIEIVQPESRLEGKVLCYLLTAWEPHWRLPLTPTCLSARPAVGLRSPSEFRDEGIVARVRGSDLVSWQCPRHPWLEGQTC